jgi:hypothetical protein
VTSDEPTCSDKSPTSELTVALTLEQDKLRRPEVLSSSAKIPHFRLRSLSVSSNKRLAVTPPEFPSSPVPSPFEHMDLSHSESPIPTEDVSSRLAELEAKLASQEARNTQALDALNTTLRLLAAVIPTQPTALPQTPLPIASATRPKLDLKPSPPPNFDGDRQNGKGFINACQAYFRLRPDQFPDEQTKIQWAMTYMNQGRAQKWANRVYHWEAVPANVRNPRFMDWDDFHSHFRTEFFLLHSDAVATNKLEGISYFQGRRMVDDYLDDFRDLISDSGYSDPKTIVVKWVKPFNSGCSGHYGFRKTG